MVIVGCFLAEFSSDEETRLKEYLEDKVSLSDINWSRYNADIDADFTFMTDDGEELSVSATAHFFVDGYPPYYGFDPVDDVDGDYEVDCQHAEISFVKDGKNYECNIDY